MNKSTRVIVSALIAAVVVGAVYYFKNGNTGAPANSEISANQNDSPDIAGEPVQSNSKNSSMPSEPAPPIDTSAALQDNKNFIPTEMEDPKIFSMWNENLKTMAICLNMKTKALTKDQDVSFENINQAINEDLGEVVAQYEDWTATDIRTPTGEVRRIHLKYNNEVEPPTRKLTYYTYKNGKEEVLPLTPEQANNPNDTAVASIEGDGRVFGQTISRRIAYINGDDLLLTERNGKVYSYSLHHDGARFTCTGADKSSTFKCSCKDFNSEQ